MSSRGRNNKLVGQAGEFLVCAELARRGYMATPFAGNVPVFDILIADEKCHTLAIQVKTSSGNSWPTDARVWMRLEFDADGRRQIYQGAQELSDPELIQVCVSLEDRGSRDRFFIFTMGELQASIIERHSAWMESHGWRRPKNPESYDHRYGIDQLAPFENRWNLIEERLKRSSART